MVHKKKFSEKRLLIRSLSVTKRSPQFKFTRCCTCDFIGFITRVAEMVQALVVVDSRCATVSAGANVEAAVLRDPFVAAHGIDSVAAVY